jgi:hypothetical protein
MTPININTLFADIIDTPEQRQEKLLQQGMTQGRLLSSNLTGLARAAAPLAQMAGQLGVQRNEDLRRAVQPLLGLDPRTTGEKLGEQIQGIDMSTPDGMLQAAQALQSIDPVRAAALRQAAAEKRIENQDRERQIKRENVLDAQRAASAEASAAQAQRAATSFPFEMAQNVEALANSVSAREERVARFDLYEEETDLRIKNLIQGATDSKTAREERTQVKNLKTQFETDLADSFGDTPEEQMLANAVRGGLFTNDTLRQMATTPATDYTFSTAQYLEGNKIVNYNVARDKNNPSQTIRLDRATNQPKTAELKPVPELTENQQQKYEEYIENTPMLNELIEGKKRTFWFDGDPLLAKQGLVDLLNTLRARDGLTLQAATRTIANSSLEDIQNGTINAQVVQTASVLDDPAFQDFYTGETVPDQTAQTTPQPEQAQTQNVPNVPFSLLNQEFNVPTAGRPAESFSIPTSGTGMGNGRDAQYEQQLDRVRAGELDSGATHKRFVDDNRDVIRKASAELRYLANPRIQNRKERIAREKKKIEEAQKRLTFYPKPLAETR